ncbi:MAG: sigma-G inhibitor, Gin [Firmicutes bacterium]|nr:sigma-G inhibitor, Gin [Bacillota bacterium]
MTNHKNVCIYCKSIGNKNNGGIEILGMYICQKCEHEITKIDCDAENYLYYVNGLKKVWCCLLD